MGGVTTLITGGRSYLTVIAMTGGSDDICHIAVAAVTGVGSVTIRFTGGSGHRAGITVASGIHGSRFGATATAAGVGPHTIYGTGGSGGHAALVPVVGQLAAHVIYSLGLGTTVTVTLRRLGAIGGTGGVAVADVGREAVGQFAARVRNSLGFGTATVVTLSRLGAIGSTGGVAVADIVGKLVTLGIGVVVHIAVAAGGTGIGGITLLLTGGLGYLTLIAVTGRGRSVHRLGLIFIVAVVTQDIVHCGIGAVGSGLLAALALLLVLMAGVSNGLLLGVGLVGLTGAHLKAILGTGRRCTHHPVAPAVTGSRNGAVGIAVTASAAGVGGVAVHGASGGGHLAGVAMARCGGLTIHIAVAALGTSMGGVTTLITGGRSYLTVVAVASGGNDAVGIAVTASAAGVGGIAIHGASGGGHLAGVTVAQSGNNVVLVAVTAVAAGKGSVTLLAAGGSGHFLGIVVAQSVHWVTTGHIATSGTGFFGIAPIFTGGIDHHCVIVMAQGVQNHILNTLGCKTLLREHGFVAGLTLIDTVGLHHIGGSHGHRVALYVAGVVAAHPGTGTGSLVRTPLVGCLAEAVARGRDDLLGGDHLAADRAGLTGSLTVLGTGGRLCREIHIVMAVGRKLLSFRAAADGTGISLHAACGTGGGGGHSALAIVFRAVMNNVPRSVGIPISISGLGLHIAAIGVFQLGRSYIDIVECKVCAVLRHLFGLGGSAGSAYNDSSSFQTAGISATAGCINVTGRSIDQTTDLDFCIHQIACRSGVLPAGSVSNCIKFISVMHVAAPFTGIINVNGDSGAQKTGCARIDDHLRTGQQSQILIDGYIAAAFCLNRNIAVDGQFKFTGCDLDVASYIRDRQVHGFD